MLPLRYGIGSVLKFSCDTFHNFQSVEVDGDSATVGSLAAISGTFIPVGRGVLLLNPLTHAADAGGNGVGLCTGEPPHAHRASWYITAQSRTKDVLIFDSFQFKETGCVAPV